MKSSPTKEAPANISILSEHWVDLRLVSGMRFILAASALLVIVIDPSEPNRYIRLTYSALGLYTLYSAVFFFLSVRRSDLVPARYMHWFDILWYLAFVAMSSGTSSIFFNFFFFAILVASFGWGYTAGLQVTLVSALLFTVVGVYTTPQMAGVEWNRVLLRPIQLLILGFMISRWGGFKLSLRNRLQLLKDVTVFSNTRFGLDRTINSLLERLRAFYDADECLLLIPAEPPDSKNYKLYRSRRGVPPSGAAPAQVKADAARLFLFPSPDQALLHRKNGRELTSYFDLKTRTFLSGDSTVGDRIANALEATNYLSVPFQSGREVNGRLYVIGAHDRFDNAAMDFLLQLLDHVSPLMENIRLVDSLASYAAEEERRRIARDIHDSVIQPYVGLQLGIAALAHKLRAGNTDITDNVEELLDLSNQELIELRRYVWGLRTGEERPDILFPAIHRFVTRFASVTGIQVEVKSTGKLEVNDRLAAELFQMVAEGLSNVRRHALCNEAKVRFICRDGKVLLQIKNRRPGPSGGLGSEDEGQPEPPLFVPRSISERAALLGGETIVTIDQDNYTVVSVTIPL